MKMFLAFALLAFTTLGCGGSGDAPAADAALLDSSGGDGGVGVAHTEDNGGVMHAPGKSDPLTNCVDCHGTDLTGGDGPSCYDCHDNSDHTVNRGGHLHMSGTSGSCTICHGPNNSGGLGPACSDCH